MHVIQDRPLRRKSPLIRGALAIRDARNDLVEAAVAYVLARRAGLGPCVRGNDLADAVDKYRRATRAAGTSAPPSTTPGTVAGAMASGRAR